MNLFLINSVEVFIEDYNKPLKKYVLCIAIITLNHATTHDCKQCQNKPWLSTI